MKGLTTKQAKLVQGIAAGKNTLQAGKDAGYVNPHVSSYQALDSHRVKSALEKLMDRQGLSERKLLKPLADGLQANVVATFQGEALESDAPDHFARLKASELGWKLRGKLLPKADTTPTIMPVMIVHGPVTSQTIINAPKLILTPETNGHGHAPGD